VDFANKWVGGGCFDSGFVQEEQMVSQSTDMAICLSQNGARLRPDEVATFEGVHMDAWWSRKDAAQKLKMSLNAIVPELSEPLVIIAVDAPDFKRTFHEYDMASLDMLARKLHLCYTVLEKLHCPRMYSGLLGGGDFWGNRPLVLLLHLLLHTGNQQVLFHNPIFCQESHLLEPRVVTKAEEMLERLRSKGVHTLGEALREILQWDVPLSKDNADL